MNKDLLQNIILEEASNEYAMLDEGFWDKLKARAKGAWAGTKQLAKNTKELAKNAPSQLFNGEDRELEDEEKDERGKVGETYKNTKLASWKESMGSKIRKFEAQMSKKAQALVDEIFSDAEDIGLEDITDDVDGKTREVLNAVKNLCTRIGKTIDPDYAKKRTQQK
jgi:hypothetical protein